MAGLSYKNTIIDGSLTVGGADINAVFQRGHVAGPVSFDGTILLDIGRVSFTVLKSTAEAQREIYIL